MAVEAGNPRRFGALFNDGRPKLSRNAREAAGLERAWQQASQKMFAAWPPVPDAPDPNLLNRAIWYGTHGFHVPYPGDSRVLSPAQVPRSKRQDKD